MSKANANNRPQVNAVLSGTAAQKKCVLIAHKKLIVRSAILAANTAIAASGSNYIAVKLQKSSATGVAPADITGNPGSDTQLGMLQYGRKVLDLNPSIILEQGEALYADVALTGSLTYDTLLSLDIEIVGSDVLES